MGSNKVSQSGSSSSIVVGTNEKVSYESFNRDNNGGERKGRKKIDRNSQTGVGSDPRKRMSLDKRQRVQLKKDKWARMLKGEGDLPPVDSPTVSSSSISTSEPSSPSKYDNHHEVIVTTMTSSSSSVNDTNYTIDDDDDSYIRGDNSPFRQFRRQQNQEYQEYQQEKIVLSYVVEEGEKEVEDDDDIGSRLRRRLEEAHRLETMGIEKKSLKVMRNQAHRFGNCHVNEEDEDEFMIKRANNRSIPTRSQSQTFSTHLQRELIRPLNKIRLSGSFDELSNKENSVGIEDEDVYRSQISKSRLMRKARSEKAVAEKEERKNRLLENTSKRNTFDTNTNVTPFRTRRARSLSLHRSRRISNNFKSNDDNNITHPEYDASCDDNDPRENLRVKRHLELRKEEEERASEEEKLKLEEKLSKERTRCDKVKRDLKKKNELIMEMAAPSISSFCEKQELSRSQERHFSSPSLEWEEINEPCSRNMRSRERIPIESPVKQSSDSDPKHSNPQTHEEIVPPPDGILSSNLEDDELFEMNQSCCCSEVLTVDSETECERERYIEFNTEHNIEREYENEPDQDVKDELTILPNMPVMIPSNNANPNDEEASVSRHNNNSQDTSFSASEHEQNGMKDEIPLRRNESYISASSGSAASKSIKKQTSFSSSGTKCKLNVVSTIGNDLDIVATPVYYVEETYSSDRQPSVPGPGVKLVPTNIEHHTIKPFATSSAPIQPPTAEEQIKMQLKQSERDIDEDDYDPYGEEDSTLSDDTNDVIDHQMQQPEVDDLESTWLDELFSNVTTCVCAPLKDCRMGSF